jgi:hypothetical protein
MKRSQAFPGNFLGKDDVPSPLSAIIADVTREPVKCEFGEEQKPIMRFTSNQLKPLILNNVNWLGYEDAYGEDSDDWRGKPAEIYVDPHVMFGHKRVGGLRLRIPAKQVPPANRLVAATAQPASAPPPLPEAPQNEQSRKAQAIAGICAARSLEKLAEWVKCAARFGFDDVNMSEIDAEHKAAKAKFMPAAVNGRPATSDNATALPADRVAFRHRPATGCRRLKW